MEATGGYAIQQTNRNLAIHQADIAKAKTLVVGLGTNPDDPAGSSTNFDSQMKTFIGTIRGYNPSINIYWLNTYYIINDARYPEYTQQNSKINAAAQQYGFTVIDVASAIKGGEVLAPDGGDNIHYSGNGYKIRSDWLVGVLKATTPNGIASGGSSATSAPTGGCVCPANATPITLSLSEEERYQTTWAFFTTEKRLSPEAAAGIMGNLKAESGIDPHNMQNTAPLPDGPQMPVRLVGEQVYPALEIEGKFGYGIAQWTTSGRQKSLIDFAASQGRSTGDLGLQLDFLWKELSDSYTSVLSTLQTPGVTVQQASDVVVLRFEIPGSVILPPKGEGTPATRQSTLTDRAGLSQAILDRFKGTTLAYTSSPTCGQVGDGVSGLINPTGEDQVTECTAGSTNKEITTGYIDGKPIQLRLCLIPSLGVSVNAQVSAQVVAMVQDAAQDGVELKATDGFRPLEGASGQVSLYESSCEKANIAATPGPYPKQNANDTVKCPGAAAPGFSNHGAGYAIDFAIPESYQAALSNPMFKWLLANASKYGFYEWGKGSRTANGYEAWHWSIDGN